VGKAENVRKGGKGFPVGVFRLFRRVADRNGKAKIEIKFSGKLRGSYHDRFNRV